MLFIIRDNFMVKELKKLMAFRQSSQFLLKVIILSLPSALLFLTLVYFQILPLSTAFICYFFILAFNIFSLFPLSSEMQSLRQYIYSLVTDESEKRPLNFVEKDTQDLAEAVNSIHRFWASKTDSLEAKAYTASAVLDTLPDPIIIIDNEGNITGNNTSASRLFGDDLSSRNIDSLFKTNIFIKSVEKVLQNKSEAESLIFKDTEHLKQRIYAHINKLPWSAKGRATAVVSLYDISKALSLEKMQSDFVANASHELRTPLSVISGFIETLQTSAKDDADAREAFLAIMKEQAEYMSSLIENLLSLSRLEMARDKELKDKVDLTEVVDDVINALKIKAFNRSLNVKQTEEGRIPKIVGDRQEIHQILQNLLDNAIKYAQEKSEITIELKTVLLKQLTKLFTIYIKARHFTS